MPFSIKCKGCGRKPDQIQEYITAAKEEGGTPDLLLFGMKVLLIG